MNIAGPDGTVIARGRSAFPHDDIPALAGKKGEAMRELFPSRKRLEVVHRDDLALL